MPHTNYNNWQPTSVLQSNTTSDFCSKLHDAKDMQLTCPLGTFWMSSLRGQKADASLRKFMQIDWFLALWQRKAMLAKFEVV